MSEKRIASVTSTTTARQRSVAEEPVTSVLEDGDIPINDGEAAWDADEEVLAALGYKPEFKREFNLWTTFCVSFAVLGLLLSFASTLYYGMGYAGTAGMTWGWLIAMIGIQSVAASMAELCSSMPTSGGLYYAAAVLAPPGWGPFAAWLTGWSNWMGGITGAPSVNYGTAAMVLAAASIQNPSYVPTDYQTFLLTVFLMIVHSCMASASTRWLARINNVGSTFNIIALVVVIILIPAGGTEREAQGLPRFKSSKDVWGTVFNGTDYSDGVAVLMSFIGVIWTMSGYDAPFHLAEECSNANIASPRAIFLTSAVGGTAGWFLQLVVAYTVVDISSVLESDLGQPFAAYLTQVLSQKAVLAVLSLTIVAGFAMGQGCMIAASRIGACAAFVAFTIPIFIRVFFVGRRFRAGPWNLGRFSIPIGAVASGFVALMVPILCLPSVTGKNLTPDLMNWTAVVYGGPMMLITVWWMVSARKWFKGPKVNLDHLMHGGEVAEVIDGHAPVIQRSGSEVFNHHTLGEKHGEKDGTGVQQASI
ncbi:hypothetical protein CLAFUR0_07351 [Fulvia fulva]|nr:hypothetical protein CLAFUR0_07351 [Fulvia fulva]